MWCRVSSKAISPEINLLFVFRILLALNMYAGNMSSSTDQKLDRLLSLMEHFFSSCEVQVNPDMDSAYSHNYGRYEDSHYHNVNGVDYSHSAYNCPYHPQYEHYSGYASPQPDFSGFMSHPQAPQHERNQWCHQSLSLNDMMMQVMETLPESWRTRNEIPNIDLSLPTLTDVQTSFTFTPEEDVRDDTSTNLEVHEDTKPDEYLTETSEECDVFQIEPENVIALNEGEDEMKIDVNSDKSEMQQIESKEDQPLMLIFYTTDTPVLDDPDTIDSFVLEVPDELLNLKEGMHISLPNYVDAPFVVDISKGEGIT
ncbi:hypothetical protein Syun_004280 [Stephania yunnanensis]|uniref:Uncharacterized protein n=1 Tax=Stephania yunnanensis TaxID=152371 RepID=A0AAP0L2R7_9MAGN